MVMTEQELAVLAARSLQHVVNEISDYQWEMVMPGDFQTASEDRSTLRNIINYHAYDDAWIPDMLAGRTMAEAGADKYDGDLLGGDPKASFAKYVERACEAIADCHDLEPMAHLSFGDFSKGEYMWQIISFRGLRAYDIAKVLKQDATLPPQLIQGMWDGLSPRADEWREYGVFGPAVPVDDDAPLLSRLLGLTGRPPN